MTTPLLDGLRVIEMSAFVAAPLGGMALAQLGADVIRIDPIAGPLDGRRWPLAPDGHSLFWAGMNRGKRSILIDLRTDEGQRIAADLICQGEDGGILLTNLPERGALTAAKLRERRPDLIVVRVNGDADGRSAVDYTVNPSTGFPALTGPEGDPRPVNHVLPAWDAITGALAAVGLLGAERRRRLEGVGDEIQIALSDVAFHMVSGLGRTADAELGGHADGTPAGNYLYGAFGRDFACADGRRVMVAAVTARQWRALVRATGTEGAVEDLEADLGLDLTDEGSRYRARRQIARVLEPWFAIREREDVAGALDAAGVCWGSYRTVTQALREDPRLDPAQNPMWQRVRHTELGELLTPGSPLRPSIAGDIAPGPSPLPGAHTAEVLASRLGVSPEAFEGLVARGIAATSVDGAPRRSRRPAARAREEAGGLRTGAAG